MSKKPVARLAMAMAPRGVEAEIWECPRCGRESWPYLNRARHSSGCPIGGKGIHWLSTYQARSSGEYEMITYFDVISTYGDRCVYCEGPFEDLDHVYPVALGGPHLLANVRPSCRDCNGRKGAKPLGALGGTRTPGTTPEAGRIDPVASGDRCSR